MVRTRALVKAPGPLPRAASRADRRAALALLGAFTLPQGKSRPAYILRDNNVLDHDDGEDDKSCHLLRACSVPGIVLNASHALTNFNSLTRKVVLSCRGRNGGTDRISNTAGRRAGM